MLRDRDARRSPFYESGIATAVRRAHADPGSCFSVYWDGEDIYVRASEAAPPPHSKCVCIAQRWDEKTVQLRFDGAHSEWVNP
jgi:hypothetical protein